MEEKVCVLHMPEDPEAFPIALVNVLDFYRRTINKDTTPTVHLIGGPKQLEWLIPEEKWIRRTHPEKTQEIHFEFYFDVDVAYDLSKDARLHMATAFGIQLGTVLELEIFPETLKTPYSEEKRPQQIHVFQAETYDSAFVASEIASLYPNLDGCVINRFTLDEELQVISSIESLGIQDGDIVIVERGIISYLATGLNANVIEVYSGNAHKGWMDKWISEGYHMIYMEQPEEWPKERVAELILKTFKGIICTVK